MRDRRGDAVLVGILEDSLLGVREGLCARARRAEEARRRRREGRDAEDRHEEKRSAAAHGRCHLDDGTLFAIVGFRRVRNGGGIIIRGTNPREKKAKTEGLDCVR